MKRKTLYYRGIHGSIDKGSDGILRGKILGLRDLVAYQGRAEAELEAAFRAAVDDYIGLREEILKDNS